MSSASGSAASVRYNISNYFEDYTIGNVYIRSRRIDNVKLGVHHYIAVDGIGDKWTVYEWGTDYSSKDESARYATKKVYGSKCISLGRHSLKEIKEACDTADSYANYSSSYNCNNWCEKVAKLLGYQVTVHWNCNCVISNETLRTVLTPSKWKVETSSTLREGEYLRISCCIM
eukprot:303450_1